MSTQESSSSATVGSGGQPKPGSASSFEDAAEAETFLDQLISVVALDDIERVNQTQKNMSVLLCRLSINLI